MKSISISILMLPSLIQSAPQSLLRIDNNDAINNSNAEQSGEMATVNDFRSLFEEDLQFNIRGLIGGNPSLSLSMSFSLPYFTPSPTFNPTVSPSISQVPSASPSTSVVPIITPSILPTSVDGASNEGSFTTATPVVVDSDSEKIFTASGSDDDSKQQTSRNISMIVVGSCALLAIAAIAGRKMSSQAKSKPALTTQKDVCFGAGTGAAFVTTAATTKSDGGSTSGGGNDVSSIDTGSDFGGGSLTENHSNDGVSVTEVQL